MGLSHESGKVLLGKGAVAATQSETDTNVIDMAGFDEIDFEVIFGTVSAGSVLTFAVKENTASSTSSPTPTAVALTGLPVNAVTAALSSGNVVVTESGGNLTGKIIKISVARQALTKEFVFLAITATTANYVIAGIVVHLRKAHSLPVTQPADVAIAATAAA